jgi:hypothetical protein
MREKEEFYLNLFNVSRGTWELRIE